MHSTFFNAGFAVVIAGAATIASGYSASGIGTQFLAVTLLTCAGFAGMIGAWVTRARVHVSFSFCAFLACLIGAVSLLGVPLLEDDHFRYLWDGFQMATTGKPFAKAPEAFFASAYVPSGMHDILSGINHPNLPTVYGPALQLLFALGYWVAPGALWPLKVMLLVATVFMARLLQRAGVSLWAVLALIVHPLLMKESANSAHPDLFVGVLLLGAYLLWGKSHFVAAAALAACAVAMKISALPALPLFFICKRGQINLRAIAVSAATLAAFYLPHLLTMGGSEWQSVQAMGTNWVFNPLLFRFISALLSYDAARACIAIAYALIWLFVVVRWTLYLRRVSEPAPVDGPPIVVLLVALLLFSPVVNPWYWLWVLPLATLHFSPVTWVAASVSLLAYTHVLPRSTPGEAMAQFIVPFWATLIQSFAIGAAMLYTQVHRQTCPLNASYG